MAKESSGRTRKNVVTDSEKPKKRGRPPGSKNKTTSVSKTKNDAQAKKKSPKQSFENEIIGDYSTEHIIHKLKMIRDKSVDHLVDGVMAGQSFGIGAWTAMYEAAVRNLEREEAIARGEVPGQSGAVQISIPGLVPGNVVIAGQPPSNVS